jgi:hypothetical protein
MNDKKLFIALLVLISLPIALAFFGKDRFRYPCQDPENWDKDFCKMPLCDVTRTCPEHIFKGQRDPRLGPPETRNQPIGQAQSCQAQPQGGSCGK